MRRRRLSDISQLNIISYISFFAGLDILQQNVSIHHQLSCASFDVPHLGSATCARTWEEEGCSTLASWKSHMKIVVWISTLQPVLSKFWCSTSWISTLCKNIMRKRRLPDISQLKITVIHFILCWNFRFFSRMHASTIIWHINWGLEVSMSSNTPNDFRYAIS